jgi:hypothetical protein
VAYFIILYKIPQKELGFHAQQNLNCLFFVKVVFLGGHLPFPPYSLLVQTDGRADGHLEESKLRLTQPSKAGTGADIFNAGYFM